MSYLIVGQRAPVREQLCNYCATKNATVFRRFWNYRNHSTEEIQEAIAGGLLIHSDPFALIDIRLFCWYYNLLIRTRSPHLQSNAYQVLTNF
jgi:hypothetical protein